MLAQLFITMVNTGKPQAGSIRHELLEAYATRYCESDGKNAMLFVQADCGRLPKVPDKIPRPAEIDS